jgi:hypothetical protein
VKTGDRLVIHFVIICAVASLGGGAVFLGRQWVAHENETLRAAWHRGDAEEGGRYGVLHGWQNCLPEALRRAERARTWERGAMSPFLSQCLWRSEQPVAGGCSELPADEAAWAKTQCAASHAPDDRCTRVVMRFLEHCATWRELRDAGAL